MITDKQKTLLDSLLKRPNTKYYNQDDYDKMGIYGGDYCQFEDEDEDDYDEDDYDEEVVPW